MKKGPCADQRVVLRNEQGPQLPDPVLEHGYRPAPAGDDRGRHIRPLPK